MTLPVIAVVSAAVVLAATPLAMVVARRTGTVDHPGELKIQTAAVPYLGGAAVFLGVVVGVAAGRPTVAVPLALALALGVVDDRFDLPAWLRLLGELGIGAAVVITCPVRLSGAPAAVAIVAVTVLLVNGVNLLDGLDALASGVVGMAAVGMAALVAGPGRQLAVALAAALGAFLVYNRPPARIYLGDGGSYLLGTALTVLLAATWHPGSDPAVGIAALAVVALPASEVAFAVVRRLRGRQSLLAGDRGHAYDRLVDRGWPVLSVSLEYAGVEALLAGAAVVVAHQRSRPLSVGLDIAVAVVLTGAAAVAGSLTPDSQNHQDHP